MVLKRLLLLPNLGSERETKMKIKHIISVGMVTAVAAVSFTGGASAVTLDPIYRLAMTTSSTSSTTEVDIAAINALCQVRLIPCPKSGEEGLPTADTSFVQTSFTLSSSNDYGCYQASRIYVKNVSSRVLNVYIVDTMQQIGYDFYELAPGLVASHVVTQRPEPYTIAVADDADVTKILYAYTVQSSPMCTLPPAYTPPVRPYDLPNVSVKAAGCVNTHLVVTIDKPIPQGETLYVGVSQLGLSPNDQPYYTAVFGGKVQWQGLTMVLPIKNVPTFYIVTDKYSGTVENKVIEPPKGCRTTYDPSQVTYTPMGK